MAVNPSPLYPRPAELLQHLIRFDTTNPPGNEVECIDFIQRLLEDAGIETLRLARSPERPNLIGRLTGKGMAPPLLLYGHVDVVTAAGQDWQHPPFEGRIVDGYVWGRGALDMKGGVAMLLAAFLKAKADGVSLPGDVIFLAAADEEVSGAYGAKYLVEEYPALFQNVRYALSEFGGFNLTISGKRFYPIQVSEKQTCWLRARFRGPGGHGSMPVAGGAMAKLGRALERIDRRPLPVHVTPPVRMMIERMAAALPFPTGWVMRQLTNPYMTDFILRLMGERGRVFSPLLHNTVSPTMIQASSKENVIPAEVHLGLDGRLLPGCTPDQFKTELRTLLGDDVDLEPTLIEPGPEAVDMGLFESLAAVLRELDPLGIPIPYVNSGVTDARYFSRLGIQTYGFTPLRLPDDFNFISLLHAANERVPVAALDFGAQALYLAMQRCFI